MLQSMVLQRVGHDWTAGQQINLFLAVLGLCGYMQAFSSCGEWGLLSSSGPQLLLVRSVGFSSCDAQAWLPCGIWDLSGTGIEPMFPALTGGLLTTGPPEKFPDFMF